MSAIEEGRKKLNRRLNHIDITFINTLSRIVEEGQIVKTRNSETTRLRNIMIEFWDTPLVSVRRTAWKNALREMEWFLSGSTNIYKLHPKVHKWWEPWADGDGEIDNNYSKQFRNFEGKHGSVDQVQYMIDTLTNNPYSRRNVITTWHTYDMLLPETPITNCHGSLIQAFVEPSDNTVHLTMNQRSCDMVLGVPHNWIQYWAFMLFLAHKSGRNPGSLTWIGGDCHIYPDHLEVCDEMDSEDISEECMGLETPNLIYNPTSEEFKAEDFSLDVEYKPIIKKSLKMTT